LKAGTLHVRGTVENGDGDAGRSFCVRPEFDNAGNSDQVRHGRDNLMLVF